MSEDNEAKGDTPKSGAIVVAAGLSSRMRGVDKIFYPLGGVPLVWHSLSILLAHPSISRIVLVTAEANVRQAEEMIACRAPGGEVSVCEGGERRQDSVMRGMERLGSCELVVIHDGARPFITAELLDRGIAAALEEGAAVAAVPVKDTIKQSDDSDVVERTLPRDRLWAVQTPQIFNASVIREAHERVQETVTDDSSMVEAIGHPVKLFQGSYSNIKVTTPEDLTIARAIIRENRENAVTTKRVVQ